jgi:hypothetical protein
VSGRGGLRWGRCIGGGGEGGGTLRVRGSERQSENGRRWMRSGESDSDGSLFLERCIESSSSGVGCLTLETSVVRMKKRKCRIGNVRRYRFQRVLGGTGLRVLSWQFGVSNLRCDVGLL